MTASIDWLVVGGAVDPWRGVGLVTTDSRIPLFGTGIEVDAASEPGMRGLVVSGIDPAIDSIDGVPVEVRDPPPPVYAEHPIGASTIDHVVIVTDDLARTSGAVVDTTAAVLKRVRETGELRQGFHRVGGLIVEVVERHGLPADSTALWGFVFVVDDLDGACSRLGPELISDSRDAVQPGRRIATVRSAANLGVPVGLMTPEPR